METRIELALGTPRGGRDVAPARRPATGPELPPSPQTRPADPSSAASVPSSGPAPDAARVVVALRGPLSETTAGALVEALCGLLSTHCGVVVDLAAVELSHSGAVHAFTEAAARAGEWPDVRLTVAAPDATMAAVLASSRVAQRIPVHPDVATALARLDERPALLRAFWRFGVDRRAPGDARGHVRRVCRRWDIDEDAREAAEIVVTELVTNAVEHAASPSVVEVERRRRALRLTVRDFDLTPLPGAHLPAPTAPRGRGLAMVAAVSSDWGVEPHRDGKTVWAEMPAP